MPGLVLDFFSNADCAKLKLHNLDIYFCNPSLQGVNGRHSKIRDFFEIAVMAHDPFQVRFLTQSCATFSK